MGQGRVLEREAYADDVVFVVSGPDAAEYHGKERLAAAWRDFLSAWNDFQIETTAWCRARKACTYC